MNAKRFSILTALISTLAQVSGRLETYRGAVVEYHPIVLGKDLLTEQKNVENYVKLIEEARKKKADIIVFPEGGLFSKTPAFIPDPFDGIAPWDPQSFFETTQTVKALSKAAKENEIYTVVNLVESRACTVGSKDCPPRGYYTYNTNVVFDRKGTVIARYAKYNLFDEFATDRTADAEISFFRTDFGVTFGTFTCFDILFSIPAQKLIQQYKVTDFVFPSFWFSELPFLTALQTQRGWAETNNVNLLASGVNYPSRGSSGTGIFNGKYGHIVEYMPEKETTKLLIADIPKFKDSCSSVCEQHSPVFSGISEYVLNSTVGGPQTVNVPRDMNNEGASDESNLAFLKDQIDLYTSEVIKSGESFDKTICSTKNFCCDFHVVMDELSPKAKNYTYRAMVFNGVRKFGLTFRGGVQSCGVVVCDGPHILNCTSRVKNIPKLFKFEEIKIKGNFNLRNSFQMPSTLSDGEEVKPLPVHKYEFIKNKKNNNMEVSLELLWPSLDLHTFAIWGRDFTRDNEPFVPQSGASAVLLMPAVCATFAAFLLLLR